MKERKETGKGRYKAGVGAGSKGRVWRVGKRAEELQGVGKEGGRGKGEEGEQWRGT